MAFAIMRCKKLKGFGSVASSLKHCFRERETPNADATRTPTNDHAGAKTTDEAMGRLRAKLPEKRRKDAVLIVEYLFTASPEWWKTASDEQQLQFFNRSHRWLADKYGADRIVVASIHRDETSPHLSCFVVPLTVDGRLSAKEFVGNRGQLSEDQTSYAEAVQELGLKRGLEGSKARHTTIREYYSRVNAPVPALPKIKLPEPRLGDRLKPAEYGERVKAAVLKQIAPSWNAGQAKATELEAEKAKVAEKDRTLEAFRRRYGAFFDAIDAIPSPAARKRAVEALQASVDASIESEYAEFQQSLIEQQRFEHAVQRAAMHMARTEHIELEDALQRLEVLTDSGQHEELLRWIEAAPMLAEPDRSESQKTASIKDFTPSTQRDHGPEFER